MDKLPEERYNAEHPEEGYPVAPSPPAREYVPQVKPTISPLPADYEPPGDRPFQYTLADMFVLTTSVAVMLSIILSIMKLFPLKTIAGATGLGALISLLLLVFWPPERQFVRIGWWMLFGFYLLTCIVAMIFT